MIKKRVNKINWHGSDLENNRAKAPNISTPGGNGLDGLNDGEIYVCNADEDPAIFIKTNKDKVARVGGNGSDSYSRDQIDDFLGKKLDKVVWDRNLEERVDDNGKEYLFLTKPLITAYGVTMYAGADVQVPSIYEGLPIDGVTIQWVDGKLVATGGKGTANGIVVNGNTYTPNEDGIITLPNYPSLSGYATEQWVNNTLSGYATSSSLSQLSAKVDNFLEGTDTDGIINKWKELESFLAGQTQTSTLAELLSVKADKATTLAGYGITDAYTKNDISGLLTDYVTKSGAQDITGIKSFINGLNIGDILVKKHSDGVVELDGDLILTGSLTMFAQGSHTASTILDALPIDETTLSKEGGVLSVIGGVGGGSVDGIILNGTTYSPNEETKLITLPNYPTTLPASDVYSWAKQPNKPSYSFSELSSHPTTLGGYGITDAVTIDTAQEIYGIKEFATTVYISTAFDTMLAFKSLDDENFAIIDVRNKTGNSLSKFGYYGDRWAIDSNTILHTGNYAGELDNRYVNKAGDSMTGSLNFNGNAKIYFNGNENFSVGSNGSIGTYLQYDSNIITVTSNHPYYNDNKIWHAGNDGSGSGLDADLLDGKHLHQGQWDSICYIGGDGVLEIGKYIDFHEEQGMSNDFSCRIMSQGDYQNTLFLPTSSGTLATLGDNVASATKLQTPRTIFGKSFDGTGNVTGGAKFANICIETDNNGNDSGRGSEINNYNAELNLQYNTSRDITMCFGGGNVGIGITPEHKLDVNGSFMARGIMKCMQIEVSNYSTQYYAAYRTFNTAISGTDPDYEWCWYHAKGEITRGLSLWSYDANGTVYNEVASFSAYGGNRFYVNGNILTAGGITMYSDLRKKNVLNSIIVPLDVMANADLFDYIFKKDEKGKVRAGTSAQYWNRFLPQVTDTDNEGFFTMSYDVLATTCVLSMAKHFQRFLIEDFGRHETEIERLKRENEELKNRVSELERRAA
jgi:hypothetical protein